METHIMTQTQTQKYKLATDWSSEQTMNKNNHKTKPTQKYRTYNMGNDADGTCLL